MVQRRLCVVISPKLKRRDNLVTVVPLSESTPTSVEDWHHSIAIQSKAWGDGPRWVKCDMIATVSYDRLSRPYYRHSVTKTRLFEKLCVAQEDLKIIREKISAALGLPVIEK